MASEIAGMIIAGKALYTDQTIPRRCWEKSTLDSSWASESVEMGLLYRNCMRFSGCRTLKPLSGGRFLLTSLGS